MTQILIIDDDPSMQMLLNRTLARQGYEVLVASSGEEGLNLAQQHQPALIICDWLMPPGINGLQVCRRIKADPQLSTIFFILLTSLGSVDNTVQGLDAGADDFLSKSVENHELQARVRAGLRLYYLTQELKREKQRLETELEEAADYVKSILPEPLALEQLTIDVRFVPSRQLGGDSFDYYWLDQDNLVIYLLDVSGHGLRAAFPSLSILNLLRSRSLNQADFSKPREVLSALNKAFPMTDRNEQYFTIWYGVYNVKKGLLIYSSAGHPPGVLISESGDLDLKVELLRTKGCFPIGYFLDSDYQEESCLVKANSTLYIFSDGIYELEQMDGTMWELDSFIDLLKDKKIKESNLDQLLEKVKTNNCQDFFNDDLSIIKINFK